MPIIKPSAERSSPQPQAPIAPIKMNAITKATHNHVPGTSAPKTDITSQTASPNLNQVSVEQASPEATKSPSPAEDPLISSKFAALAKREKHLRQKMAEYQAKEQELKTLQEERSKYQSFRDRLKTNPLDVLNEEGVTYDQLVQRAQAMVDPNAKQALELQAKIERLEAQINKQTEETQKAQSSQRDGAVRQINMDVQNLISSNSAYETVKDFGYGEAVTELIVRTYDEEGIMLNIEDAANKVESYLKAEVDRINSIPAIKKRLQPVTPQVEATKQQEEQKNTPTTLSHAMNALTNTKPVRSWTERRRDAILAAQGKLVKG